MERSKQGNWKLPRIETSRILHVAAQDGTSFGSRETARRWRSARVSIPPWPVKAQFHIRNRSEVGEGFHHGQRLLTVTDMIIPTFWVSSSKEIQHTATPAQLNNVREKQYTFSSISCTRCQLTSLPPEFCVVSIYIWTSGAPPHPSWPTETCKQMNRSA
jgi:hypothetical protein